MIRYKFGTEEGERKLPWLCPFCQTVYAPWVKACHCRSAEWCEPASTHHMPSEKKNEELTGGSSDGET